MSDSLIAWCIYALKDPRTNEVRYIGWSVDPRRRFKGHINESKRETSYKAKWICKLLRDGVEPVQEILERGSGPNWIEAERRWITLFRSAGYRLTNTQEGGAGSPGRKLSAESLARMSMVQRGRKASDETRRKMSASQQGRKMPQSAREKISAAHVGKTLSVETRQKIAQANKTRQLSPEAKANMHKGLEIGRAAGVLRGPLSADTRAKISEALRGNVPAMKGKTFSAETRANMSAAHKGYVMPLEQKQSIAAAMRLSWARRRAERE